MSKSEHRIILAKRRALGIRQLLVVIRIGSRKHGVARFSDAGAWVDDAVVVSNRQYVIGAARTVVTRQRRGNSGLTRLASLPK
jgi:hypothetical protein